MARSQDDVPALREWIKEQADQHPDASVDDLLLQSRKRDPMWKGTRADWEKAEWFAKYWRIAADNTEGDRVHCRGVHYTIYALDEDVEPPTRCSWDTYDNTTECYSYLKDASVVARVLGTVPLDGVTDDKNTSTRLTEYNGHVTEPDTDFLPKPTGVQVPDLPTPDETASGVDDIEDYASSAATKWARQVARELDIDTATLQGLHIELWSEKSIPEEAKEEARRLGVSTVVEGQGDLSYTVAANLASRIEDAGKPAVILYLSDFDPKGDNMATAMSGKLSWLQQRGDLSHRTVVKQLAVTREQIEQFDLTRKPIDGSAAGATGTGGKAYDTLVDDWEKRKGAGATELQAFWLDMDRLLTVIRETMRDLRDDDLDEKTREARSQFCDDLADAVEDALLDAGLEDHHDDLTEWVEEFNDRLADVSEELKELRDLKKDERLGGWLNAVTEAIEATDQPDVELPDADASLPESPLFDSDRSYGENLQEVKRHENGERHGGER